MRDYVVREDFRGVVRGGGYMSLESRPPFHMEDVYRTERHQCPTCGHTLYEREGTHTRRVFVSSEAATRRGRNAYIEGLAFDVDNAMARVAWRLGVSCIVCGRFIGLRRPQSYADWGMTVLGAPCTVRSPLCGTCAKNERRDIRRWQREHPDSVHPPDEWLLLKAVERLSGLAKKSLRRAS